MNTTTNGLLAVITARAGSKRIKNKCITKLCGRPLIEYVIEAALGAKSVSRLIVSTDGENIAKIARRAGADVPFLRPAALAKDDTPTLPVLKHALGFCEKQDGKYRALLCLQPTSPLITSKDIDDAWSLFLKGQKTLTSVHIIDEHPEWLYTITKNNLLKPLFTDPGERNKRSQLLPEYYTLNGMLNIFKRSDIISGEVNTRAPFVVSDKNHCIDIDTPEDLARAEKYLKSQPKYNKKRKNNGQ